MTLGITKSSLRSAVYDIGYGLASWRLWSLYGNNDIKLRYRRSSFGPFWATLSTGVYIGVTALAFSLLFHLPMEKILPYICISLIMFNQLSNIVADGTMAFIGSGELILQIKRPLTVYLWQTLWRNILLLAHSLVIFIFVIIIFGIIPGPTYFLAIPGFIIYCLNAMWMVGIVAVLSTRFRDVPLIVPNVFTILLWMTPVFYRIDQIPESVRSVIYWNPIFHILELVRSPLLLSIPSWQNWAIGIMTAVLGWLIMLVLFARSRSRIPYWL